MEIKRMAEHVHENAKNHGWWGNGGVEKRPIPEILCLVHSEVSEALEAYRRGNKENYAEELADIVIRVFDAAEGYKIDIEKEIIKKHEYNLTRPYRHGGKKC